MARFNNPNANAAEFRSALEPAMLHMVTNDVTKQQVCNKITVFVTKHRANNHLTKMQQNTLRELRNDTSLITLTVNKRRSEYGQNT